MIGDNQIEKAFIRLRQVTSTDEDLNDAVLILKSQWEELSKNKLTGVLAPGEERQIHAKIASGMLDLCRLLDGNNLKINKDLPPNKMPERTTHPSGIYIWIGFGLFLVILIILLVIPCPTPPQFFAFRLGMRSIEDCIAADEVLKESFCVLLLMLLLERRGLWHRVVVVALCFLLLRI